MHAVSHESDKLSRNDQCKLHRSRSSSHGRSRLQSLVWYTELATEVLQCVILSTSNPLGPTSKDIMVNLVNSRLKTGGAHILLKNLP